MKFSKSNVTNALVSFITIDQNSGYIRGVKEDSQYPKLICIPDKKLLPYIESGVLYDVEMVRAEGNRSGYIVVKAEPHQFPARISTSIVRNAIYKITISFGNKTLVFDPMDGKKDNVRTIEGVVKLLEARKDIRNLSQVIEDFTRSANILLLSYENDGNYVPRKKRKA